MDACLAKNSLIQQQGVTTVKISTSCVHKWFAVHYFVIRGTEWPVHTFASGWYVPSDTVHWSSVPLAEYMLRGPTTDITINASILIFDSNVAEPVTIHNVS
jgi:hypothetical protein